MKSRLILSLLICFIFSAVATAQTSSSAQKNIVEQIEEKSGGNVEIDIPDNIMSYLMPVKKAIKETTAGTKRQTNNYSHGPKQTNGFRIQIFSDGRNQSTLQSRANARANAVLTKFPKYRHQIYSFSKAPNWYTRVGNFKTQKEASDALAELRRAFPAFAGEMRVVKSAIVVVD